jgi:hypothetical protein
MSLRHAVRTVAVTGAAVLCGALFLLAIDSGVAGAQPTSGDGFTTVTPADTETPTPGTPFSSGQLITVNVNGGTSETNAACAGGTENSNPLSSSYQVCNGASAPTGLYYFEECEDLNGTTANLPSGFAGCEEATMDTESGDTSTGAVEAYDDFAVHVLPDSNISPSGPTMTAAPAQCGLAPYYCVIGIFASNPNSGHSGFSSPHLWSAPFQVSVGDGQDAGDSPGDGTPEAPLAIGLPLAAMGVVGGVVIRNRRRDRQQAA